MKTEKGFTLIEVVLAIALLSVLTLAMMGANKIVGVGLTSGQNKAASNRLAQEGMEAVLAIRADDFTRLSTGEFHPEFGKEGWELIAGSEQTEGIERIITISSVFRSLVCGETVCEIVQAGGVMDENSLAVEVRAGEVVLNGLVTYWR